MYLNLITEQKHSTYRTLSAVILRMAMRSARSSSWMDSWHLPSGVRDMQGGTGGLTALATPPRPFPPPSTEKLVNAPAAETCKKC